MDKLYIIINNNDKLITNSLKPINLNHIVKKSIIQKQRSISLPQLKLY